MRAILLSLAIAVSPLAAHAAIPQTQRDALIAFYASTHGDAWTSHTGWNGASGSECSWQGVTCDAPQSNVNTIVLLNNNLAGPIPTEIGNLPNLTQINLGSNKVTGPLPASLSNLAALQGLSLSNNQISGPIPPELGRLASLQVLNLDSNALSGTIPAEIGSLHTLQRLDVRSNQFVGTLPPTIGSLASSLTAFLVSNNQLTGGIDVVLQLTKLQILALDGNQFTGEIPAGIGGLTALQAISMGGNQFSGGIPAAIGNLSNLQSIDFTRANLSGPIPASLGQLANLQFLTLSLNKLTGALPPELGSLRLLQWLLLDRNALTGSIPDSIANLKSLVNFQAWNNSLTGPIPSGIGQLTALQILDVSGNQLSGGLPPSITQLVNLQRLNLDENHLTGSLPADIGSMKSLIDVRMNSDGLQGTLPPSIGDLSSLQSLTLSHNELSGPLPAQIGNLHRIVTLSLYDNEIDGTIPPELGNLTGLHSLSLAANHFTGTIPKEIGALTQLTAIDLSLNALRGPVPVEIENLTSLVNHSSAFDHNLLFTSDAALSAFLDLKQANGGQWAVFQTVPPANVRVAAITDRSATITWDRTLDLYSEGGYEVVASTSPGGAPVALATTPSKQIASIVMRGLSPMTQYFFTVSTVTHPIGLQKNLLISDPTAAIPTTTTARVLSPPDVAVSSAPQGLVQIDGVAVNQDSFTLTNYGDSAAAVTLIAGPGGDFFSFTPAAVTLAAGESKTVTLSSIVKPAGSYFGSLFVQGQGAGVDVFVALLSVVRPAGTVNAVPVSARVEVAGPPGSDIVGIASYKNTGTAPLSGIVVADADWVQPSNAQITIFPGATAAIPFTILASRRPPNLGALSANLRLVYVAGTSANGILHALDNGPTGVSVSIVTVVSTTNPPTSTVNTPSIDAAELALFAPGLVSLLPNGATSSSNLSITNISTASALSDLKVFFTPAGSALSTVASFNPVGTASSMSLVNVVSNLFGSSSGTGTLQIRGSNLANASAFATITSTLAGAATIGDVPILRSDRSAKLGDVTVLTGIRGGADLYVQETSGQGASVRIDFLDENGGAAGTMNQSIGSLFAITLAGVVPNGAVTAIVTNNGPGNIAAYARVTDASGDTWSVVDWRRTQNFDDKTAVRIPFVHGSTGFGRRRIVAHASTPANQTDVTLFNPGDDFAIAHVDVLDPSGRATSRDITVASHQTLTFGVASPNAVGQLIITPSRGGLYATGRDYRVGSGGTVGAAVPVIASTSGLRLGQSRLFAGVEDSTSATIAAAGPATYRSSLGLVETAGQSATVGISIAISETSSLTSAFISQTIDLAPNQQIMLDPILRSVIGSARDSAFGDLHTMKLEIDVTSGNGAVVPFIVTTDNGSGDTYIRLQ